MQEHEQDAAVSQRQGGDFAPAESLAEEERGHQQDDGRIEVKNQPFERGRDVLQPEEVEVARGIVAEQSDDDEAGVVGPRQR